MSEYDKLVKWLTKIADHSPYLALGSNRLAKVGEAAQAIERLERKLETVSTLDKNTIARRTDRITALEAELADARAEIERKDKALEPFARYADPRRKMPASLAVSAGSAMAKRQLTMGDCYRAAEALATQASTEKE